MGRADGGAQSLTDLHGVDLDFAEGHVVVRSRHIFLRMVENALERL